MTSSGCERESEKEERSEKKVDVTSLSAHPERSRWPLDSRERLAICKWHAVCDGLRGERVGSFAVATAAAALAKIYLRHRDTLLRHGALV